MTYRAKKQNGVALLLALGFLSLLLVMGIAFVTNATVARKSAANSRANAQARTLAQAAVNRLLAEIRYTLKNPGGSYVAPAEMTSAANESLAERDDTAVTLKGDNSLLAAYVYGEKYVPENIYKDSSRQPKWEFWYDKYTSSGGKAPKAAIIGRTAFMALSATASVNLSEVLRGAAFDTPTGSWSRWDARRGASMRELFINADFVSAKLYNRFKDERFDNDILGQDAPRTDTKAENYPDYDAIFTAAELNDDTDPSSPKRNWLQSWILPGGSNEPEIFAFNSDGTTTLYNDKTDFFHRFNLARRTTDDKSVWDADAGTARITVDMLLGDPLKFNAADPAPAPTAALPWLKCIKGDDASHDETYTAEVLRKQVAANLIDYCDSDSEATSDSADWKAAAPTWTGNEKTPYINEVMFGITGTTTRTDTKHTTAGDPPVITYTADYETRIVPKNITVELINIYQNADHDGFAKTVALSLAGSAVLKVTPYAGAEEKTVTLRFDTGDLQDVTATLTKNGNYAYATLNHEGLFKLYNGEGTEGAEISGGVLETANQPLAGAAVTLKAKVVLTKLTIDRIYLVYDGKRADYVRTLEQAEALEAENEVTPEDFGSGLTRTTESTLCLFAGFAVDDPRMNLYQTTGSVTHWSALRLVKNDAGDTVTEITGPGAAEKFTFGEVNDAAYFNPAAAGTDAESFGSLSFPDGALFSTAFIADKPMRTLAELGVIHRGEKWRTINLKCSSARVWHLAYNPRRDKGETAGYTYANGDAAILDQVKLTKDVFTAGKVNLNRYPSTPAQNYLFAALFEKIAWNVLTPRQYAAKDPDNDADNIPDDGDHRVTSSQANVLRNQLGGASGRTGANQILLSRGHMVDFLKGAAGFLQGTTDVQKETVPAASAGLTSSYVSNPDIIQFVVVAQSIRDVGTSDAAGITMTKFDDKGDEVELASVKKGQFDYKKNGDLKKVGVYFDEITGEVKMLVTVQINALEQTVKLLKTELLD